MSFFPFLIPFLKAEKWYGSQVEQSDWKYAKYKNVAGIIIIIMTLLANRTTIMHAWTSPVVPQSSALRSLILLLTLCLWTAQSTEMLSPTGSPSFLEIWRLSWATHPYSYSTRSAAHKQVFLFIMVTPMCQKMNQQGRIPAWLNRDVELSERKKGSLWPLGEGEGNSGGLQGHHEVMQGKN